MFCRNTVWLFELNQERNNLCVPSIVAMSAAMAGDLGKQSQSAAASYAAAQDEAVRYMRVPVRVPVRVSRAAGCL
jgi:hypothetical protein